MSLQCRRRAARALTSWLLALSALGTSCVRIARIDLRPTPQRSPAGGVQSPVFAVVDSVARRHYLSPFTLPQPCSIGSSNDGTAVGSWQNEDVAVTLCADRRPPHRSVIEVRMPGAFGSVKETLIYRHLVSALRARFGADIVVEEVR